MRIEGLYYDQQGNFGFNNQLIASTTIRVGLSAQSYPFPAPTGIADIALRLPGEAVLTSVNASYGPYGASFDGQVELNTPLIANSLGIVVTAGGGQREVDHHAVYQFADVSGLLRWTSNDGAEIISFAQRSQGFDAELNPLVLTAGAFLPPEIDRSVFYGQDWARRQTRVQTNIGLLGRGMVSNNWRIQAGAFRSYNKPETDFAVFYRNTQPDGRANLEIRENPPPFLVSYSGEARASGVYPDGPRRHTLNLSARGRVVQRLFGGGDTESLGPATIGVRMPIAKPVFALGPQSEDDVRQGTLGASYVLQWLKMGEVSAGVQKSFYKRDVNIPGLGIAETSSNPWLYNGTAAGNVTDELTVYAGYTRGLEESGIAPENASNPGEALPASLTRQIDAGIRYRITPSTTLLAGVFKVDKPYFDRDPTNLFTRVGSLSHRGIELSLSSQPLEGLKVVVGALLLQARASGSTVVQGLIGAVPPGRPPILVRLNANYGPAAWRGFSVNAQINYEDAHYANRINTLHIRAATQVDVGARYSFKIMTTAASLRVDVRNLTNYFGWTVAGASGQYSPLPARRFTARLVADF